MTSRKGRGKPRITTRISLTLPPAPDRSSSRYLDGVVPLPRKPARVAPASPKPALIARVVSDPPPFSLSDDGMRIEGKRDNLDPSVVRGLRRKGEAIDARLDLHGLSREEARRAVEEFVLREGSQGARLLLVIHGKGLHSHRGSAVLRTELPHWLTQPPCGHLVLCFTSARPEHGGEGALYVLVRSAAGRGR